MTRHRTQGQGDGRDPVLLRPPDEVMRLARMGASFPTRLSFLRVLLRRLAQEGARVTRPVWNIDAEGHGHAVYSVPLGGHVYSLVAFARDLPPEQRTDRVIATAWDTAYVLYDGIPDADEIARLALNAPLQEAGRFTRRDLVLSRANKSVRLFAEVTAALRAQRQPDAARIGEIGYLMRTTAVYGNGKFGIADRRDYADRPGLSGPFMAEMLTVWLIRGFTHDLIEHLGGGPLDPALKRHLGIGNATGLGMAPFLVSHPELLHNWVNARETALARVRAVARLDAAQAARVCALAKRAGRHLEEWNVPDPAHQARIVALRRDWHRLTAGLDSGAMMQAGALDAVFQRSRRLSLDLQELCVSWMLEPFGPLIDDLAQTLACAAPVELDPQMSCARLATLCAQHFAWLRDIDFDDPEDCAQFWYVSEDKQEPRLGLRFQEPGATRESPLDTARRIQALWRALMGAQGDASLARFLLAQPGHRDAVRRVQRTARTPYAEIRDNLIGADCLPIDMLRCKLAFFGAAKFDPKSDRWTRITLCQGAPLAQDLAAGADADDWWLPAFAP